MAVKNPPPVRDPFAVSPIPGEHFAARRRRLAEALAAHPVPQGAGGATCAVLFSTPTAVRNHDVEHPYRADADLHWLTGFDEPDCAAVLRVEAGETSCELFLRPRDPSKEVWTGRRLGPERAPEALGVDGAWPIGELEAQLPRLLWGAGTVFTHLGRRADDDRRVLAGLSAARARTRRRGRAPAAVGDVAPILARLRWIKDAHEIERMEAAARASILGHLRAMAACRPGTTEGRLEAELSYAFRGAGGEGHAYNPIVASGENACILHYEENHAQIGEGDLVLIDAGAEVDGYAADITRTFPASGRFSSAQRDLYDVVVASQKAAIERARPGVSLREIDETARRALAEGLVSLGLLEGEVDGLTERVPGPDDPPWVAGKSPLDRFYMHGTGHYLGLDVHDAGPYHDEGVPTPMEPGVAFTVEPGVYVSPDDEEAPAAFRGIGIRIEDDVLLTDDGHRVLTADLVKEPADVEEAVGTAREQG